MKKIYTNKLFISALSLFTIIVLMSNSSGRGFVFGQAVAGAPGDSNMTCASSGCHSSGAFSPEALLRVEDSEGNAVTSFSPGQSYDVTLEIQTTGNASAYGFQMVALTSEEAPVNNWGDLGDNMRLVPIGNRDYIEHSSPNPSNEFTARWTAPESGTGDITFYFAANAVNGNGSPSGDGGTNSNFVLSELTTSSEAFSEESISLYPLPAGDYLTISGDRLEYNYVIYDMQGRQTRASKFSKETTLDISDFKSGLYFIRMQHGTQTITKKIIKN